MRRRYFLNSNLMVAALLSGLLLATLSVPLNAQPAVQTRPTHGFGPAYDAAHETTLEGTIAQVQTKHIAGRPAGLHVLVAGPKGTVDVHLGAFLSKQTKESLIAGMPVHVVGANTRLHGITYLFARQLTIGDRTVTVRTAKGMLVPERSPREKGSLHTTRNETTGGAR